MEIEALGVLALDRIRMARDDRLREGVQVQALKGVLLRMLRMTGL